MKRLIRALPIKHASGFTMLEVVIAMAIGAIGVMAFAGLQLKSLEISEEAYERSVATFLAIEMVERMSSNAQDYQAQQTYMGDTGWVWNNPIWDFRQIGGFQPPFWNCLGWDCTPTQMAEGDIDTMRGTTLAMLPNGDMGVYPCGDNDTFQCVVVAWEDADRENCNLSMDGSGLEDCFVLQVKIW